MREDGRGSGFARRTEEGTAEAEQAEGLVCAIRSFAGIRGRSQTESGNEGRVPG